MIHIPRELILFFNKYFDVQRFFNSVITGIDESLDAAHMLPVTLTGSGQDAVETAQVLAINPSNALESRIKNLEDKLMAMDTNSCSPGLNDHEFLDNNDNFSGYLFEQIEERDRVSEVLLSTVTVSDTIVETTLFTAPIEAYSLKPGTVQRLKAYGLISTVLPGDVCTFRLKAGGTTVATLDNPGRTLSDECWNIEATTTIRSIGTSGVMATRITIKVEDETEKVCELVTLDTDTVLDLTISAEWNNAKTGNAAIIGQAWLEHKHEHSR